MSITKEEVSEKVYKMVMWGEPNDDIFAYMTSKGIGSAEALAIFKEASRERLGIIRRKYIGKAILGAVMLIGAFTMVPMLSQAINKKGIIIGIGLLGVFGLNNLVDGIIKVVTASKNSGSIAGDY